MRKVVFIIISLVLISCEAKIEKINEFGDLEKNPDMELKNMETIFNTNSRLTYKITAPIARNYTTIEEPYSEFPEGLSFIFYDEYFNEVSSMVADYGIYYIKKELWKVTGNVFIQYSINGTVETEELYGDLANERIYTLKYVKVTDIDGSVVEGKGGFVSNFGLTNYEFKDVSGIFEQEIEL